MRSWVVRAGDEVLANIEASAADGTVTLQVMTSQPITMTADQSDDIRAKLGLASGVARGGSHD